MREFVIKIEEDCNLSCTYCYMYELADQLWKTRPRRMSSEIFCQSIARIASYCSRQGIETPLVVLHGGEPLLAGAEQLAWMCAQVRAVLPRARLHTQVNGTLLSTQILDVMLDYDLKAGVSTDGTPEAHDEHRIYRNEHGSHARMSEGLALLASEKYHSLYSGLLCVMNPAAGAIETYEALMSHHPPAIDFLWPLASNAAPPLRLGEYGPWLTRIFDRWYDDPEQETRIRIFERIMRQVITGEPRLPGEDISSVCVIESDGTYELSDTLKSVREGESVTGLSVLDHGVSEISAHADMLIASKNIGTLCGTCSNCLVRGTCGSGVTATRWNGTDYASPSVYCGDLMKLIIHVSSRVRQDLREQKRSTA
jgi:uncharacterized protein